MSTTRMQQRINAPRGDVYRALIDSDSVRQWMVPDGMTSEIYAYEAKEGGFFRISLTYEDPNAAGKSTCHTDTYHGHFITLVPGDRVVEVMEFETPDPSMAGEMTMTFTLTEADGATLLEAVHENVPAGVRPEDNELGWRMSLGKLAKLVESRV
jgi:uncharacterized protein YndB with AHSA1/START domain